MTVFRDRAEAGQRLAEKLQREQIENPVVLGIPRGGVPVAAEVARVLGGTLGVVVARKLGAPGQPELAIGAVTADGSLFLNESLIIDAGVDRAYVESEQARKMEEARRREELFDGHHRPSLEGRTVIVVDDGLATGATAIAALRSVRAAKASRVILAIPVAPPETVGRMRGEADQIVCVALEADFWAVGQFYRNFEQVDDHDVARILREFEAEVAGSSADPRRVVIARDGVYLAAVVSTPPGPGPFPAVAFVHGLGSDKDSPRNVVIAERLLDAGVATVLFDLNGHGESTADARGGEAFADDLKAVWEWMARQGQFDRTRMGVSGSSLGGVVALEALRNGWINPRTLVLRAPPIDNGDASWLKVPSLAIVGSADPLLRGITVAAGESEALRLEIVPGAGHLFEERGALERAAELSAGWFVSQLVPLAQETRR